MKRQTYVDKEGNIVDRSFESKKPILNFFFVFGTILPIVIIIIIVVAAFKNNGCLKIYNNLKSASLNYAKDEGTVPNLEGESVTIQLNDMYDDGYINTGKTDNQVCSGDIKITKYKKDYIYTVNARNCGQCSVNVKYGSWSSEQSSYPSGKAIIDVIPYYNYYDREVSTTKWSDYFDDSELQDEISEYGIRLPMDMEDIPKIPTEAKIINIESDSTYYYRYRDRRWKWYDIQGDYSDFSSEQPAGYANKDENSEIETNWSEYSLNYPAEKDYRTITQTTGYKFYYLNEKGEKIYYNSGKYSAREEVNTDKYDQKDEDTATLYRYKDKQWRWYNGTKRKYSSEKSTAPKNQPYKDRETEVLGNPTNWEPESDVNAANQEYRLEERKIMTRFRTQYEMISLKVLKNPLTRKEFEEEVKMSIPEFASNENYKLDVTYKFKYKKS